MTSAAAVEAKVAESDRWRWVRLRRRLTRHADVASFWMLGLWALVGVTGLGGAAPHGALSTAVPQVLSSALLALLLVARRALDPVTPLREVPLLEWLAALTDRASFQSRHFVPAAAAVFALVMGAVALSRHWTMRTSAFDLGVFENTLWNTVHGRVLWSDVLGRRFWGEHLSLILLPLAVPYALVPRAETLLVLQTLALAAGALPLARLARSELGDDRLTSALVLAYLAYLPLRSVARFDFHPVALATPLLLEAFVSFREGRWRRGTWAWALALACDEGVAPVAAMLGLYVALVLRERKRGIVYATLAIAWLLAAVFVIIPWFRGGPYPFFARLATIQSGALPNLLSLDRLRMLAVLLVPLAFLPLVSPAHALLAAPSLAINLLSDAPHMHSVAFHYTATVTPMLFVAAVLGVKKLADREDLRVVLAFYPTVAELKRYLAALLVLGAIVFAGWSPVWEIRRGFGPALADRGAVLARVPPGAAVSAQAHLGAQLARRSGLALFPERLAPFVVVDGDGPPWPLAGVTELRAWMARLRGEGGCAVAAEQGAVALFRCDAEALERLGAARPE